MNIYTKNLIQKLETAKASIQSFFYNEKGTAAIEFALISPLLIASYFGAVEVSRAYITQNKVEAVTEIVADLVTQGKTITIAQLDDIFTISSKVLKSDQESLFNVVVTSVRTEPDGGGNPISRVSWSESKTGANERAVGMIYTELPAGIAKNYESIIITELYYKHSSLLGFFVKGEKTFDRRFISKPRYSLNIPCTDC